jgi:hypothetical protein
VNAREVWASLLGTRTPTAPNLMRIGSVGRGAREKLWSFPWLCSSAWTATRSDVAERARCLEIMSCSSRGRWPSTSPHQASVQTAFSRVAGSCNTRIAVTRLARNVPSSPTRLSFLETWTSGSRRYCTCQ